MAEKVDSFQALVEPKPHRSFCRNDTEGDVKKRGDIAIYIDVSRSMNVRTSGRLV